MQENDRTKVKQLILYIKGEMCSLSMLETTETTLSTGSGSGTFGIDGISGKYSLTFGIGIDGIDGILARILSLIYWPEGIDGLDKESDGLPGIR